MLAVDSLLLACAVAAGAPGGAPPRGPAGRAEALLEIRQLASVRDLGGLERLRASAGKDPLVEAVLAGEIYWTADVAAAAVELAAVCRDARLPPDSAPRGDACARLAFATLAPGGPLRRIAARGEAPLHLDPSTGLLVAEVSLDGSPPAPFIMDTGAPTTVVARAHADRVRLSYRPDLAERSRDVGGNPIELHPGVVHRFRAGGIEVDDLPVHVQAFPETFRFGGLLSPFDLLRGIAFELDGPGRVLRVGPDPVSPGWARRFDDPSLFHASLLWSGGNAFVPAALEGLPRLPFLLDSGGGMDLVCEEVLRQYGVQAGGRPVAVPSSAGVTAMRGGFLGELGVGAEALQPVSVATLRCPGAASLAVQPAGYVGAPWFLRHRAFFPADRRSMTYAAPAR